MLDDMKYQTLQDILFRLPTETSHYLSLHSIAVLQQLKLTSLIAKAVTDDPVTLMGIEFPNRVGLAAGLDKDAKCIAGLDALGFGFIEVGTVTPKPQRGNPKPRLFRIPSRQAIINRMGFNNEGVDEMSKRIRRANFAGVLGVNIGKNAKTADEDTLSDYTFCMRKVYEQASYIVVNISSPNTQGLRAFQHGDELARLLEGLRVVHRELQDKYQKHVPLLVKIAPDMDDEEILTISRRLLEFEVDGVIVSNTTVSRSALLGENHSSEKGGLSGDPLRNQSNHVLAMVASEVKPKLAVIGVGGIMLPEHAAQKIELGADLVQLYTGFIYSGPDLIAESSEAIRAALGQINLMPSASAL